jgi:hypothetical protein
VRIANPRSNETLPTSSLRVLWRRFKTLLIVTVILELGALNILTIVNDQAHAAGFNFLKSVLTPLVTEANLSRLLSHSPTQKYTVVMGRTS